MPTGRSTIAGSIGRGIQSCSTKACRLPAPCVRRGNVWLSNAQHLRKGAAEPQACFTQHIGARHLIERGANWFPAWLHDDGIGNADDNVRRANLSGTAQHYLERLGMGVEDLFHHVLATLHAPAYREANAGALRMEWPRIPLPELADGTTEGAPEELARSAARGRDLARLLESRYARARRHDGRIAPGDCRRFAVPATTGGRNMAGDDFMLTAGWGHYGREAP